MLLSLKGICSFHVFITFVSPIFSLSVLLFVPSCLCQIPNKNNILCPELTNRGINMQSHKFVGIGVSIESGERLSSLFRTFLCALQYLVF